MKKKERKTEDKSLTQITSGDSDRDEHSVKNRGTH